MVSKQLPLTSSHWRTYDNANPFPCLYACISMSFAYNKLTISELSCLDEPLTAATTSTMTATTSTTSATTTSTTTTQPGILKVRLNTIYWHEINNTNTYACVHVITVLVPEVCVLEYEHVFLECWRLNHIMFRTNIL